MNEEKLQKTVKRIKHFFISTCGWSVDGIKGEEDEFSYSISIPYNDLTKGFFRFINLFTLGEDYYISRYDEGYIIDFPKTDEEITKESGVEEIGSETTTATT